VVGPIVYRNADDTEWAGYQTAVRH
jgi:hypothetical protein